LYTSLNKISSRVYHKNKHNKSHGFNDHGFLYYATFLVSLSKFKLTFLDNALINPNDIVPSTK